MQAMESGVEKVSMRLCDEVTLDRSRNWRVDLDQNRILLQRRGDLQEASTHPIVGDCALGSGS